jgi:hypothetical protein
MRWQFRIIAASVAAFGFCLNANKRNVLPIAAGAVPHNSQGFFVVFEEETRAGHRLAKDRGARALLFSGAE